MRKQQFLVGNISIATEGELFNGKTGDVTASLVSAIYNSVTEAFKGIKALAKEDKNHLNQDMIFFAARYEDRDKENNIYEIIKGCLNDKCGKIYQEVKKQIDQQNANRSNSSSSDSSSSNSSNIPPIPMPTGTLTAKLSIDHTIIRYTPETVWSNMFEDSMCEVHENRKVDFVVDNTGSCSYSLNNNVLKWDKNKCRTIDKTSEVILNYLMDAPSTAPEFMDVDFRFRITKWDTSFTDKDKEHIDWCVNHIKNQIKELACNNENVLDLEVTINDDISLQGGTGHIKVPRSIGDYGLQRRIEDVRKQRQDIPIEKQTDENKFRLLSMDITFTNGITLYYNTDKDKPSQSLFSYRKI